MFGEKKKDGQLCMAFYNYEILHCDSLKFGHAVVRFKNYPPTAKDVEEIEDMIKEKSPIIIKALLTGWQPLSEEE